MAFTRRHAVHGLVLRLMSNERLPSPAKEGPTTRKADTQHSGEGAHSVFMALLKVPCRVDELVDRGPECDATRDGTPPCRGSQALALQLRSNAAR